MTINSKLETAGIHEASTILLVEIRATRGTETDFPKITDAHALRPFTQLRGAISMAGALENELRRVVFARLKMTLVAVAKRGVEVLL